MIESNNTKELLKMLNEAFNFECNDTFLYSREAGLLRKEIKTGAELADKFEKLSEMELRHADRVAAQMITLGGAPSWEYELASDGGNLKTRLKAHLAKELYMHSFYDNMLKLGLDNDFAITVKGIKEDEKEHIQLITHILEDLK